MCWTYDYVVMMQRSNTKLEQREKHLNTEDNMKHSAFSFVSTSMKLSVNKDDNVMK